MANRAAGKGYENENFYTNIKFHFLGIENIHVMRNSQSKLLEGSESHFSIGQLKTVLHLFFFQSLDKFLSKSNKLSLSQEMHFHN